MRYFVTRAAMGFAAGIVITLGAGAMCVAADRWANRRAAAVGEALHGRWLG